jgi:ribonuclease HI
MPPRSVRKLDLAPALPEGSTRKRASEQKSATPREERISENELKKRRLKSTRTEQNTHRTEQHQSQRWAEMSDSDDPPHGSAAAAAASTSSAPPSSNQTPPLQQHQPPPNELPAHLVFRFDGACRGNGGLPSNTRSAFGVFAVGYSHWLSSAGHASATTNNAAELTACIHCFDTICSQFARLRDLGVKKITVLGDSLHVIAALLDRRLHLYRESSGSPNSDLWLQLAKLHEKIERLAGECNVDISIEHVPRYLNLEPDQMCNCFLDQEDINPDIRSRVGACSDLRSLLDQLLPLCATKRRRTLRTLPDSLSLELARTVEEIFTRYDEVLADDIFIVLPHLISARVAHVKNRAAYGLLRDHLCLLPQQVYLAETIAGVIALFGIPQRNFTQSPVDDPIRIKTLAARGLFSKMLTRSDITIADATNTAVAAKITAMFPPAPTGPLPDISQPDTVFPYNDILAAVRKMRRGTAPGLSGWTREYLYVILTVAPCRVVVENVTRIINNIANGKVSPFQRALLCNAVLHIFQYTDPAKAGKLRPITVLDLLTRVAGRTALRYTYNKHPDLLPSFTTDCINAVRLVQAAAAEGCEVALGDATNAFNVIFRRPMFEELKRDHRFAATCNIITMLYGSVHPAIAFTPGGDCVLTVQVSTGTRQGDVFGTLLFQLGMAATIRKLRQQIAPALMTTIADDFAVHGPQAHHRFELVADTLKTETNLDIRGSKQKYLNGAHPQTVPVAPYLGSVLVAKDVPLEASRPFLQLIFDKARDRTNRIVSLPTSIAVKCSVLRVVPMWYIYYAATYPTDVARQLWDEIDRLHFDTFLAIHNNVQIQARHAHIINTPIEGGGYGILALSAIASSVRTIQLKRNTRSSTKAKSVYAHTIEQWNKVNAPDFCQPRHSWMTCWPTTSMSTVTDTEALMYFYMRFDCVPQPYRFSCEHFDRSKFSFTDHWLACASCNKGLFWTRHEAIVAAQLHTLRYARIPAQVIRSGAQPLPGNDKGGPDYKVHPFGISEDVDVSVQRVWQRFSEVSRRVQTKRAKYADYERITKRTVCQMAMSHLGALHPDSLQAINNWAAHAALPQQFTASMIAHTQIALLRGCCDSYQRVLEQYNCGSVVS